MNRYSILVLTICASLLIVGGVSLQSYSETFDNTEDTVKGNVDNTEEFINSSLKKRINTSITDYLEIDNIQRVNSSQMCNIGGFNFTTSLHISEINEQDITINSTYSFEKPVDIITKNSGLYNSHIPGNYYGIKNSTITTISYNYDTEHPTDQGHTEDYTVVSPNFKIKVTRNESTKKIHNRDIFNCVQDVTIADNTTNIETVILGEDMLYIGHNSSSLDIYTIDVKNQNSDISVIGNVSNANIHRNAMIIAYIENQNITTYEDRYIEQYILKSSQNRPPGVAYDIRQSRKKLIVDEYRMGTEYATTGHEWIHTVQTFSYAQDAAWFIEGSAEYLGAVLEYNVGSKEEEQISNAFSFGWEESVKNVTLSNQSSWKNNAEYNRGSNVSYLIDTAIRKETNGKKDLTDLIRKLNKKEDPIEHKDISNIVGNMTTEQFQEQFNKYINSSDPVIINQELEKLGYEAEITLPRIFSYSEYNITRCKYNTNIMSVQSCTSNSSD
jgi:hypothetical protein